MNLINLTSAQLRQAANLKDEIASLNKELAAIIGGRATPAPVKAARPVVAKKGGMSAAGKARIVAAQKLRWARIRAAKAAKAVRAFKPAVKAVAAAKPARKRGKISQEGMARIIAATKLRWAKFRAAKAAKKK